MDKAAVGFDYKSQAEKHDSQKGELGKPRAAGCVGTGAGTLPAGAGGTVVELCNLLHGWWGSYGELPSATAGSRGVGQVQKAIA